MITLLLLTAFHYIADALLMQHTSLYIIVSQHESSIIHVDIANTIAYNNYRKDVCLMTQQFIHVRVDPVLKKDAEKVLGSLGLTMTKGIHLFLNSVIRNKGLPFEVKQSREELLGDRVAEMERGFQRAVARAIDRDRANGYPIALYDKELNSPYLEYADGRREYVDA